MVARGDRSATDLLVEVQPRPFISTQWILASGVGENGIPIQIVLVGNKNLACLGYVPHLSQEMEGKQCARVGAKRRVEEGRAWTYLMFVFYGRRLQELHRLALEEDL